MNMAVKLRKPRKKMTAEQKLAAKKKREAAKFRLAPKEIFTISGFKYIKSENKEFKFVTTHSSRTTELDGIYVHQNIIVIVEDTVSSSPNEHLAKKCVIFSLINEHPIEFIKCLCEQIPEFKEYISSNDFTEKDYIIRLAYFSMNKVGDEHKENANKHDVYIIERPLTNYFIALAKTLHQTTKYEIFKYLNIKYSDIGQNKGKSRNTSRSHSYEAFLLPEENSSYPTGYKVVTFYADPKSLLEKSYVLRKNGWLTPNLSYQRILDSKKIKNMRKYLSDKGRVYVNNIIATLPAETKFDDPATSNQLRQDQLDETKPVRVTLPDEFNIIGIIDGQHRIFSYHEGVDAHELQIKKLRSKQNLLVTGIIHQPNISDQDRVQFEARLFQEINSQQTKVKSSLTQEIELIVNPYSTVAIAKAVVSRLSKAGALKEKLEEHIFDTENKLKISSIVTYGLKPLVKRDGDDSLFHAWSNSEQKANLLLHKREALDAYIDFCTNEINLLLNAVKFNSLQYWRVNDDSKILTPTSVNGFLSALRLIIKNGRPRDVDTYRTQLEKISEFDFKIYKSSQWNQLGIKLFSQYF
ncbi:DGQHR domain-containing protein [Pseudomonas tensinigenes]|uniref:DGQHR domain-containing protein n=1 Tax=Pseudomonas tensinigenes TaxID=2745511 RepID=A0ABX8PYX2_9PSED|nr:DGQHR domain-containing protein [Pseudomonas tensinigenes]QXI06555.1 DGQHR domain-containing protein [Pseudomonas tensinigenes]